jgi:hypothetical protein
LQLNVKYIKRLYFLSNSTKDIRGLFLTYVLFLGLLVIATISLIKLDSVVPGEQYMAYNELRYLIPAATLPNTKLNPYYITGFVDGEGNYFIGISANSKLSTGYRVKVSFQIGLHEKDRALLELIQASLGVGILTKQGEESIQYRVYSIE